MSPKNAYFFVGAVGTTAPPGTTALHGIPAAPLDFPSLLK